MRSKSTDLGREVVKLKEENKAMQTKYERIIKAQKEEHNKTKEALNASIIKYQTMFEKQNATEAQSVDIGFMFASPIVTKDKKGGHKKSEPISYK